MSIVKEENKGNLTKTITEGDVYLGVDGFTDLSDTPTDYTGSAEYLCAVNSSSDGIEFINKSTVSFPSGTKQLFGQSSAPPGWTQDTSINDRVIRLTSGSGGSTGGSWTISGCSVGDHTLTIAEIPSHNHDIRIYTESGSFTFTSGTGVYAHQTATSYTGGGQAHNHPFSSNGSWRPSYVDMIMCVKN